jgi:hypothetical protein
VRGRSCLCIMPLAMGVFDKIGRYHACLADGYRFEWLALNGWMDTERQTRMYCTDCTGLDWSVFCIGYSTPW